MRKLHLHLACLHFIVLFHLSISENCFAQCPPHPDYIPLSDTYTATGWTPVCRDGADGYVRFDDVQGGLAPKILRIRDIHFSLVASLNIGSGTSGEVTGLSPGTYIVDITDACGEDSADKMVQVMNPSDEIEIHVPGSGFFDFFSNISCGDTYSHRTQVFAARSGQTIKYTFTNHLGDHFTHVRNENRLPNGNLDVSFLTIDIPGEFFDGMPIELKVESDQCGNHEEDCITIPYFDMFEIVSAPLSNQTPDFQYMSPDPDQECLEAFRIHRLRKYGVNPIHSVIEQETFPGSDVWIPGMDVLGNEIPDFLGNIMFRLFDPHSGTNTEGTLIFSGLSFGSSYRITYSDACGNIDEEFFLREAPDPSLGSGTCLFSGSLSEAHHIEDGGSPRLRVLPLTGVAIPPFEFTIIEGPEEWTSNYLNLDGLTFSLVDFSINPISYITNSIDEVWTLLNLPYGTYRFRYVDACGNSNEFNVFMDCVMPKQYSLHIDRCSDNSGNAVIDFRAFHISRTQQYRAALYNDLGQLVQIGSNFSNTIKRFTNIPSGNYELRFGGVTDNGEILDLPVFNPPLPRLDGQYIYKIEIDLDTLQDLDVEYLAYLECEDDHLTILTHAKGGFGPYMYRLLDQSLNVFIPFQENGLFTSLPPGEYFIEVIDQCGRTRIRPVEENINPIEVESGNIIVCAGAEIILNSTFQDPNIQYQWLDPGGQIISNAPNLILIHLTSAQSGTYTLRLILNDPIICNVEFEITLTIIDRPVIENDIHTICTSNGLIILSATPNGGSWLVNGQPGDGVIDPSIYTPGEIKIIYTTVLSQDGFECTLSDTSGLIIKQGPFIRDTVLYACETEPLSGFGSFNLESLIEYFLNELNGEDWEIGFHSSLENAHNGENLIETNYFGNSKTLYVRLTENGTHCYAVDSIQLIVNQPGIGISLVKSDLICLSQSYLIDVINASEYQIRSVSWQLDEQSEGEGFFHDGDALSIYFSGTKPGKIIFNVQLVNEHGCSTMLRDSLYINPICEMHVNLSDPCNCNHPGNIYSGNQLALFHEELNIIITGAEANIEVRVDLVISGFRDQSGNLIEQNFLLGYTNEEGNFYDIFNFYRFPGEAIDVIIQSNPFYSQPCDEAHCDTRMIPAIGDWGLIILLLCFLIIGKIYVVEFNGQMIATSKKRF